MPDYSKGKIYRISAGDLTYYGSTAQHYLSNRLAQHRKGFRRGVPCASALIFQIDPEAKAVLVENYPCKSIEELRAREQHYIDTSPCVNKNKAYQTKEDRKDYLSQHYQVNKQVINAHNNQYYQENKEAIRAKRNEKTTCECGGCYTHQKKSQHLRSQKHQDNLKTLQS